MPNKFKYKSVNDNLVTIPFSSIGNDGSGQSNIGTREFISDNHVRITDTNSNTRQTHLISNIAGGQEYTVSVEFKKLTGTPTFRFQIQGYIGGSYARTIKFTNTEETGIRDIDGWQIASWTFTLAENENAVRLWWQDGADYTTYTHSFELKNPDLRISEAGSIFKGNWAIDTSSANSGGGPSNITRLYHGAPIPNGGYTVYSVNGVFRANTEDELLGKVRNLGGDWSSVSAALTWAAGEPTVIILNKAFDNQVTDGLVLKLDASTISSFNDSQPTINLATDTPTQGGWTGTYDVLDSSNKEFLFKLQGFHNNSAGWRSWLWPMGAYIGQTVTISAHFHRVTGGEGDDIRFDWVMLGMTNDDGHSYLGYADAADRIQKVGNTDEKISWTGTIASVNSLVGFTFWCNANGIANSEARIHVSNVQIEIHDNATPFVNGTRLQNSTWHNLSGHGNATAINSPTFFNNSFIFDQSDEYFSLANTTLNDVTGNVTLMGVCKQGNTSYPHQTLLCTDINYRNGLKLMSRYHGPVSAWLANSDGTNSYLLSSGVDITNDGRYHHIATTRDASSGILKIYVDGILKNSVTTYTGETYTSNIAAVGVDYHSSGYNYTGNISAVNAHNITLSEADVLQNYYQAPIVTDGLITALDFSNLVCYEPDNNIGYDLTGNDTFDLFNSPLDVSTFKGGISFSETDEFLALNDVTATDYVSAEVWYTRTSAGEGEDIVFNKESCWELKDNGGNIQWALMANNKSWFWYDSTADIAVGETIHFVLTYDGNYVKSYKNGELVQTYTYPSGGVLSSQTSCYPKLNSRSCSRTSVHNPGNHTFYEFRIYDRAITLSEVQQNFNAGRNRFGI
jgi:hypothetical protein